MKTHHHILLIVAFLLVGGFLLWPNIQTQGPIDELTGTWRGEASAQAEYQWWMEYEFHPDGTYRLTTDSDYAEGGTYTISERFLDGSILVKKTYADGTKEYDMAVMTTDDPDMISIEGAKLYRE